MYIQVISGWRYRPTMREKTQNQVDRMRSNPRGAFPLMSGCSRTAGTALGNGPHDANTGVAIWVWESRSAADAYTFPWQGEPGKHTPLDNRMDFSTVCVRELDGMYIALAPDFLRHTLGVDPATLPDGTT